MNYRTLFLFLLLSINLFAQTTPVSELKFDAITINDGLSQGMVNCILQDRYGFMWFGTKDGLNRYDGYSFVTYKNNPSDLSSISENFITSLYEDSKGRLWIGTAGHGLDLFDREKQKFIHFRHNKADRNSICDDRIVQIVEDKNGDFWAGTVFGLAKFTEEKKNAGTYHSDFVFKVIDLDGLDSNTELFTRKPGFALNENFASSIHVDHTGVLWVSTYGQLFNIVPGKNEDKIKKLDLDKYIEPKFADKDLEKFVQLYVDDTINNNLYLIFEFNIVKVNLKNREIEILTKERFNYGLYGHQAAIDGSGKLWLPEIGGLITYDLKSSNYTYVIPRDVNLRLGVENVYCVYKDRSGVLWIGTKGYGVLKYNQLSEKFHHTDNRSFCWMIAIDSNTIGALIKDVDPLIFDIREKKLKPAIDNPSFSKWYNEDVGSGSCFIKDSLGNLWASKSGLVKYDIRKNKVFEYRKDNTICFPIYYDGEIWLGSENAFSRFDEATEKYIHYYYPVLTSRVPYEFLQAIYRESKNVFWLGTISGLFRLDIEKKQWKQFKNISGDPTSLSNNVIFSLASDPLEPGKYLWIGTNGGGLNKFEIATGKFQRFSEEDGLPNSVVYGILKDGDYLWMSTNKGLSRLSLTEKKFTNFSYRDGLQGNEFNRNAFCKAGYLFFGGINGFNYFTNKELVTNNVVPPIVITNVTHYNKPFDFGSPGSTLKKPVYMSDELVFDYGQNMITIEFAALDFTSTYRNKYLYKLEGFDETWVDPGNNHAATYTNLDPGEYVFTVKGSNNDGVWNNKGVSIRVIVRPPWYKTTLFLILSSLLIASFIYSIYRYRLAQILKVQKIRNSIASDLHDEIGSNLSAISIFSEVGFERSKMEALEVAGLMKKISDYSQSSLEAISDIVWTINSKNDRFENIISKMRSLAAELCETRSIDLKLNVNEKLNNVTLGMEARRNLYLIYKEALNNLAKYSDCSAVFIDLEYNLGLISLVVSDNGRGFEISENSGGNGLQNMKKRAEALGGILTIHSQPGKGTRIKLVFRPKRA